MDDPNETKIWPRCNCHCSHYRRVVWQWFLSMLLWSHYYVTGLIFWLDANDSKTHRGDFTDGPSDIVIWESHQMEKESWLHHWEIDKYHFVTRCKRLKSVTKALHMSHEMTSTRESLCDEIKMLLFCHCFGSGHF